MSTIWVIFPYRLRLKIKLKSAILKNYLDFKHANLIVKKTVGGNGLMTDKNSVNPLNGEFTQIGIEKGNITDQQIEELIRDYFIKKEKINNRTFTPEEKLQISTTFLEAIHGGKAD